MPIDLAKAGIGTVVAELQSAVLTREMLACYAQASGDLNPLHLEPAAAQKAGFPDVIVHGMLGMAQLGRLLTLHFAAERLVRLESRFTGIVPVNERLHCTARLQALEDDCAVLDLEARTSSGGVAITGRAWVRRA